MAPIKLQFKDLVTKGLDSGAPEQEASPSKPASMLKKKKKVGMKKPKPVFTVFDVLKLAKKPKMTHDEGLVLKGFNVPNGYSLVINTSSTNKTLQSGEYSGGPYTYQEVANGQVEGWQLVPNQSQTAYEGQDYFSQQQQAQQQQQPADTQQSNQPKSTQPDPQYQMPWDQSTLFGNGDDSDPFEGITFDEEKVLQPQDLTAMVQGVLNSTKGNNSVKNHDEKPGMFIDTPHDIKNLAIYGDIVVDPNSVGSMHLMAFLKDLDSKTDAAVLRDLIDSQDEVLIDAVLSFDKTYMTGDWATMEMAETFLRLMYASDEGLNKSQSFNNFVDSVQNLTPEEIESYMYSIGEKLATIEAVVTPLQAKLEYETDIIEKASLRENMMVDLGFMEGSVKRLAEDGDIVGAIIAAEKSTAYILFAHDVMAYDNLSVSSEPLDIVMQFSGIQSYSEILIDVNDGILDSLLEPDQKESIIQAADEDEAVYNLKMALRGNQLTGYNSDDKLYGVLSSLYAHPAEEVFKRMSSYALALGKEDISPLYMLQLSGLKYEDIVTSGNTAKNDEKQKISSAIRQLLTPVGKAPQVVNTADAVKAQQSRGNLLNYVKKQGTKIPRFLVDAIGNMQLTGREAFYLDIKDPADLMAALPGFIKEMLVSKPLDYHAPFITEQMVGPVSDDGYLSDVQLAEIMHSIPLYQIEGMTPAESRMHHIMNSMEPKILDSILRNPYAKIRSRMDFRNYMQSCFEDSIYEKLGEPGIASAYKAIWSWTTGPLGVMSTTGMAMKYYWAKSRGERDPEQEWGMDKRKNPWTDHKGRTQPADYVDIIREAAELGPVLDIIHDLSTKLFKATLGDHNKGPLPGSKVVYRGMFFNPGTDAHSSFIDEDDFRENSTPKLNTLSSFSHTRDVAERFADSTFQYGALKGIVESVVTAKDAAIDCRFTYASSSSTVALVAGTHNSAAMSTATYSPKSYNDYTSEDELITYSSSENPARYAENTLDQDRRTTMKVIHGLSLRRK